MKNYLAAIALLPLILSFSSAFGMKQIFQAQLLPDDKSQQYEKEYDTPFNSSCDNLQSDNNPFHLKPPQEINLSEKVH